jgi:hypothetical protein
MSLEKVDTLLIIFFDFRNYPNYNLTMLNNFRSIIRSQAWKLSKTILSNPYHRINPQLFKSLYQTPRFNFCSKIDKLKNSDKTFELLIGKLKNKVDYCEEL